jgi:pimeloyl-ACP methyl ester carboxylesterase
VSIASLDELAHHLVMTLPSRFDAVALSRGGAVALRIAISHPERMRRLVLVTTAGGIDMSAFGAVDWRPSFTPAARLEVIPEATHDLEEAFPDLLASLVEAHLRS